MDKKGFTLIELLVSIAVIISITTIAIVGVTGISNKSKEQAYERVKDQIMTAAEQYFDSREYLFENLADDAYGVITVGMLVDEDYLNKVTDPRTGKSVNYCSQVQVSIKNGRYVSKFKEYEDGIKCDNDSFVSLKEPGSASISITPYKSGDKTHAKVNSVNGWYNIKALGEGAKLALYVTADTQGNGKIKGIKRCTGSTLCTDFGNDYITDELTYEDTSVYGTDTSKTACYLATNISGNSAYTCFKAQVDTVRPIVNLEVEGTAKNNGNSRVKNYTGDKKWYTSDVDVLINDMSSDVKKWSWRTDSWSSDEFTYEQLNTSEVKNSLYITAEGSNRYVEINLTDKAGNTNTYTKKNINIDKTVPKCTVSISGENKNGDKYKENGWYTSNVRLTGKCQDATSGCKENTIENVYNNEISKEARSPGYVTDNAGNSTICDSKSFGVDRTAPVLHNATLSCDEYNIQNRIVLEITDNYSGFADSPFTYTHSRTNDSAENNYYTEQKIGTNKFWHGFGYVSSEENIVTINSITLKDNAGNSKTYSNNPISCSYASGGRNKKAPYSCPDGNPETQCTIRFK